MKNFKSSKKSLNNGAQSRKRRCLNLLRNKKYKFNKMQRQRKKLFKGES